MALIGNSFNEANPSALTANDAPALRHAGNHVVQLSNPRINTAGAFERLPGSIVRRAHGQEIGLVGFSAGGALALRIAQTPGLKVNAVLDDYGVPDVRAYLQRHSGTHVYRPISGIAPFRARPVSLLSGPIKTSAYVVAAFGRRDPHVRAETSSADLLLEHPSAHVYTYDGGHGVPITASRPALEDFLAHV